MIPNPLALIAEITHRCPLHCVYCSNPLQMIGAKAELSTEDWVRVFQEAQRPGNSPSSLDWRRTRGA